MKFLQSDSFEMANFDELGLGRSLLAFDLEVRVAGIFEMRVQDLLPSLPIGFWVIQFGGERNDILLHHKLECRGTLDLPPADAPIIMNVCIDTTLTNHHPTEILTLSIVVSRCAYARVSGS